MNTPHEKASYAFYTYVFNGYDKFVEPLKKYMSTSFSDDKSHEIAIQNAICKMLSEKIRQHIYTLPEIKKSYVKSIKLLSKQNLDSIEFNEKYKKRESRLKTNIKLHFILEDVCNGNYELEHAGYLMAIYLKFVGFEREPNGKLNRYNEITKLPEIKESAIYKYLEYALEQSKFSLRLKSLNQLNQEQLINGLYYSMASFNYINDQSTVGEYLTVEDKNKLPTVTDLTNDYSAYEEFQDIIDYDFEQHLNIEMHIIDNGIIF